MIYRACVLVPYIENHVSTADLDEIGLLIAEREPRLLWKTARMDVAASQSHFRMPALPIVVLHFHAFDPAPWPQFEGPRLTSERLHKVAQLRTMQQAGIPVPRWTRLERNTQIDPAEFGEFLIIKPTDRGASLGRGVTLIRTSDFERYRDEHAPAYEGYRRSPPVVQEFVYTGEKARQYRVLHFLGRTVLAVFNENQNLTPFNAPVQSLAVTEKVISVTAGIQRKLVIDPDVVDLARKVAEVFPDRTMVGVDILRAERTGGLYVLEANMGNVWMFSNNLTRSAQEMLGRDNMKKQFGAPEIIADAIVERARQVLLL